MRVFRLQPNFEIALKKPQSCDSAALAIFTAVPSHTSVGLHLMWGRDQGQALQGSRNVQSNTVTANVLKPFLLESTSSVVGATISQRQIVIYPQMTGPAP